MRTKTMEALIRLEDHLKCFPDIAAQNKRFKPDGS
ncbi:TraY domain-containing protein [Enterobacter roggenkampii]|nr:TraY domain-containing protein [Enterobacter roggenkampii]